MSDPGAALSDEETGALKDEYVELIFFGGPQGRPRMEEIDASSQRQRRRGIRNLSISAGRRLRG